MICTFCAINPRDKTSRFPTAIAVSLSRLLSYRTVQAVIKGYHLTQVYLKDHPSKSIHYFIDSVSAASSKNVVDQPAWL